MDSHITRQIGFMNTSIRTQEIAQSRPTAFAGVNMHFSDAISIIIACPFVLAVTDSMTLCAYNSETTDPDNLVSRAKEKTDV
jgi:hypothetical protein